MNVLGTHLMGQARALHWHLRSDQLLLLLLLLLLETLILWTEQVLRLEGTARKLIAYRTHCGNSWSIERRVA